MSALAIDSPVTMVGDGQPLRRMFLVFFRDGPTTPWWSRLLKPGFRHVTLAAYFANRDRWITFDAVHGGTVIDCYSRSEFPDVLGELWASSAGVLRFPGEHSRRWAPVTGWCLGAVKGVLGVHCAAPTPWRLYRALLARGAEIVSADEPGENVISFRCAAADLKAARMAPRL
jgi:hypothetical protein